MAAVDPGLAFVQPFRLAAAFAGAKPAPSKPAISANIANKEVMNFGSFDVAALCNLFSPSNVSPLDYGIFVYESEHSEIPKVLQVRLLEHAD